MTRHEHRPACASATEALDMVHAGLRYLATADATELTVGEQAECLRSLERANSAAPPRELAAGQS